MKKLKLFGIPALLLAGAMTLFTPSPADARVRVGVAIGAPYYTYGPYGYAYYGGGPYYYHWHHYHHWR
jgi:hypothetical protein